MGMRSSSLSCCSNKTLVQDQVCTDWSITGAGTQIVYTNNITQEVYGSGYVKYDVGANPITVDFLVGATVVDTITVGNAPLEVTVSPNGARAYVTNIFSI